LYGTKKDAIRGAWWTRPQRCHMIAYKMLTYSAERRHILSERDETPLVRHSTAAISDDDSLSDSDTDVSSDEGGCHNEEQQDGSSQRKNVRWPEIDELRLGAYVKAEKPWKWIFKQFPGRTEPAIRTRWHLIQKRAE
jgi:hypothetical protein